MNNDEETSIHTLAAEYVLGTLEKTERDAVEVRRKNDPLLDQAIINWQAHLAGLNDYVQDAEPRKGLFNEILNKLDKPSDKKVESVASINTVTSAVVVEMEAMRVKLKRWRFSAFSASAIAACLAIFMVVKPPVEPTVQANSPFVAVFQADDSQPAFIMSLDINTRQLTVRPVMAQGQAGKTYQLWIKSDDIGPAPRSLGLLANVANPIQKQIDYDPAIIRHATFGISVEPMGGSPTGVPTGPAIHGRLYPTSL
ncbi:anti-sigma factor [Marinomonas sp. RSW2]|uniref:Anti-sigma factor n=1 Tax=Marinomonas maritima TaxID=2940935 RepID=A0ABT5WEC1_9GAMM|nr:anti-sigma factor [Marinomonas maritima]MDE8601966.1 anti-sigma factor [Marinomonas maritima]